MRAGEDALHDRYYYPPTLLFWSYHNDESSPKLLNCGNVWIAQTHAHKTGSVHFLLRLVSKIRGLHAKRHGQTIVVFHQYSSCIERCIKPFMWIDGHGISKIQSFQQARVFIRQ